MKRALFALLVVAAAAACSSSKKPEDPKVVEEAKTREAFAKELLNDAGVAARQVVASADVQYLDGFSPVVLDPPDDWWSHAFRWVSQKGHLRLRTKGNETMYFKLAGWMHINGIDTRPDINLDIDGQPVEQKKLKKQPPDRHNYEIAAEIDPKLFHGKEWIDLYVVFTAVAWHWYEWPDLRVLTVTELEWKELEKHKKEALEKGLDP